MADEDGWLDGWEHVNLDTELSWTGGPGKLALHTAEGRTMASLINTFKSNPTIASQLGLCWRERRKVQFISLLHSGKALRNLSGGVQTNRDQVYQIEIIGFWTESPHIPDEGLQFIGEAIAEVWLATGGAFQLSLGWKPLVGPEDGYTARVNAPQRYSATEWDEFNQIAGHCNVPENEHTDPGKLNMDRILEFAWNKINAGEIPQHAPQEDKMFEVMKNTDGRTEILQLGDDGVVYSSWQLEDGSLSAWAPVNPHQPGAFKSADAYVAPDGRLAVVALLPAYGGIPFICSQSSPSNGPWTDWVNLSALLKWLAVTKK